MAEENKKLLKEIQESRIEANQYKQNRELAKNDGNLNKSSTNKNTIL